MPDNVLPASYASLCENQCETKDQCDAIAARAAQEGWSITTCVATADEVAEAKRWSER